MGILPLIKTQTASGSDYLDFVDGASDVVFDGTYDEYMFVCTDINPATDDTQLTFQVNATDDTGGGYDTSLITSTFFNAYHPEDDSGQGIQYSTTFDLVQSASFQSISQSQGNDADASAACILHIFRPSSTTYVKEFYARCSSSHQANYAQDNFIGGYVNDTTAIDEFRFMMSSGAFDGVIQLYGIA